MIWGSADVVVLRPVTAVTIFRSLRNLFDYSGNLMIRASADVGSDGGGHNYPLAEKCVQTSNDLNFRRSVTREIRCFGPTQTRGLRAGYIALAKGYGAQRRTNNVLRFRRRGF